MAEYRRRIGHSCFTERDIDTSSLVASLDVPEGVDQ